MFLMYTNDFLRTSIIKKFPKHSDSRPNHKKKRLELMEDMGYPPMAFCPVALKLPGDNGNDKVEVEDSPKMCVQVIETKNDLGGGFKDFLFSPLFGEDSHFD